MNSKCSFGGQAVIEGVMMRGKDKLAIAVRKPTNEIILQEQVVKSITNRFPFLKLPIFRGMVSLVESLVIGIKALTFSANQALDEEEELGTGELLLTMGFAFGMVILLFVVAPALSVKFVQPYLENSVWLNLVEGVVRILIFLAYVLSISFMKDIKRVFEYHGAEHKVIHAYEAGVDLTVENVRKFNTLHPRCGTSFLLIVMVISILVFSFLGKQILLWRILSRIILLPLVAGLSYEIIKLSGKAPNHPIMKVIIAPGLWLQKLTTKEPDDAQLEVAIKALQGVLDSEPTDGKIGTCNL